jgi:hypothetical protein
MIVRMSNWLENCVYYESSVARVTIYESLTYGEALTVWGLAWRDCLGPLRASPTAIESFYRACRS